MPGCSSGVINWAWKSPLKFLAIWNCRNVCSQVKTNNITLNCLLLLLGIFFITVDYTTQQILFCISPHFVEQDDSAVASLQCFTSTWYRRALSGAFVSMVSVREGKSCWAFEHLFWTPPSFSLCVSAGIQVGRGGCGALEQSQWDIFS